MRMSQMLHAHSILSHLTGVRGCKYNYTILSRSIVAPRKRCVDVNADVTDAARAQHIVAPRERYVDVNMDTPDINMISSGRTL